MAWAASCSATCPISIPPQRRGGWCSASWPGLLSLKPGGSERTRDAMAAAKASGATFGGRSSGTIRVNQAAKDRARQEEEKLRGVSLLPWHAAGLSLRGMGPLWRGLGRSQQLETRSALSRFRGCPIDRGSTWHDLSPLILVLAVVLDPLSPFVKSLANTRI